MNELLIFAKAPRLGSVKTRLAQELGSEQALLAYCRLLAVVADQVQEIQHATVYFSPADSEDELRPFFPAHWNFRAQNGADLGERLQNALAASFASGSKRVAVIGADCPYLDSGDIAQAWEALDHNDVVLGPANDGGYWLIAMSKLHHDLFVDIDWGTGSVLAETLARTQQANLKVHLLRTLGDVDTERDWCQFLATSESDSSVARTVRNLR